ncbi:hypothetical protein TUBRATIS_28900, partial [Tubulinosema ratisbonensis]
SEENRNLIPIFYFFKNNEEEIKESNIEFKNDLLNIISFVKQQTNDLKLTQESLNKIREKFFKQWPVNFEYIKIRKFFRGLFTNMFCCENDYEVLSHKSIKLNKTSKLFNIYGLESYNSYNKEFSFFAFLAKYQKFKPCFYTKKNKISFDISHNDKITILNIPKELFFINYIDRKNFINPIHKSISKRITEFPNLEIKDHKSSTNYEPSEFIFSIDREDKTEILYGCKNGEIYEVYNSDGIVENFDMNEEFNFIVIKYKPSS